MMIHRWDDISNYDGCIMINNLNFRVCFVSKEALCCFLLIGQYVPVT